ncbi:hypothetical protein P3T76_011707 [Phytophthora citrophthora]|uniref:RxLR effector protein n=1 Tax=Phytophthora citrophthora TaxID=4793 RepID=A0AAD9G8T2_9STRA|nr:hypothetical protein P3T76_011707 [Phytophthora citrophthora]
MRLRRVLVFLLLTTVGLTCSGAASTSTESILARLVSGTSTVRQTQRVLRVQKARGGDEMHEERVFPVSDTISLLGQALLKLKEKGDQRWWTFRGFTPDQVLIILNVGKHDEKYREYVKYFYNYFIRNFDEPLSQFPPQVIDNIWKARLRSWLDTDSPPLVFKKLGLIGSFKTAEGQTNYELFKIFYKMWRQKQMMMVSKPVKLDIVYKH